MTLKHNLEEDLLISINITFLCMLVKGKVVPVLF